MLNENLPLIQFIEAQARDFAIEKVSANSEEWLSQAMIEMASLQFDPKIKRDYPNGFTMTNVRSWLVQLLGEPHHHNVYGALTMKCIRSKIIYDTGQISRTGAHARKQSVYKFVGGLR